MRHFFDAFFSVWLESILRHNDNPDICHDVVLDDLERIDATAAKL